MKHNLDKKKTDAKAQPKVKKFVLANSNKKIQTSKKKSEPTAPKQRVKTIIKKPAAASVKNVEPKNKKTAPIIFAQKVKLPKNKLIISKQKVKPTTKKAKFVTAAKTTKTEKPKQIKSIKKSKSAVKNLKSPVSNHLAKPKAKKVKADISIKKTKLKKVEPVSPSKKAKNVQVKTKPANAKGKKKSAGNVNKSKQIVSVKKTVAAKEKSNAKVSAQKVKPKREKTRSVILLKKPNKEKTKAAERAVKTVELKKETVNLPRRITPKKKKAKPIGSAVFRGKKNTYDFEVFGLNEPFEQIPAVCIISKRKTDKRKKGHHALICIGQTNSLPDEIQKHRKSRCLRKNNANVISILVEADEKRRLKIETDLKAAHAIACNLG